MPRDGLVAAARRSTRSPPHWDLAPLLSRRVAELSGGERQRVALARSLLTNASLLLLDEPMSALDAERKADILSYLESLSVPMLYVSHAVDEVALLAERTLVLADGRVRAFGATREILERLDIQSITGRFEAGTLVRARVMEHDPQYQLTILEVGGQRIVLPMSTRLAAGDFARVRVRARDVALATSRPRDLSIRNILSGTLIDLVRVEDSPFAEALVEVVRSAPAGAHHPCLGGRAGTMCRPKRLRPGQERHVRSLDFHRHFPTHHQSGKLPRLKAPFAAHPRSRRRTPTACRLSQANSSLSRGPRRASGQCALPARASGH